LAVPVAMVLRTSVGGGPASAPIATLAPVTTPGAPQLTEAAGVQACASQRPDHETPVRPAPGSGGALADWTSYVDSTGLSLNVPVAWGESRIGALLCFRDPNSLKTIAVYDFGRRTGDPVTLVDDTDAWRAAASLDGYRRLGVEDMHLPEGGAMLEYTYQRG